MDLTCCPEEYRKATKSISRILCVVNGGNSDDYSYEYCGLSSNPIGESRTNGRPFTLWGFRSKSSRRHSQGQIEPTISNGDYASMHQPDPLIGGF